MANLQNIWITLNTHNFVSSTAPVAHIFVKNRSNTSSTPESDTTFIANNLAYERAESANGYDVNPYLGRLSGAQITGPTVTWRIPLRSIPIPNEELVLPVVNIHLLPPENFVAWIFDYQIIFEFERASAISPVPTFSASSNTNGVTGIILDGDNRDHTGICTENPFNPLPSLTKPPTDSLLYQITVDFYTHDGSSKPHDTQVNLHIVNRQSSTSDKDLAVAVDIFKDQEFTAKSLHSIAFNNSPNPLSSNSIHLADMILPMVNINIAPKSSTSWEFDYRVRYYFTSQKTYYSTHTGVILNLDYHKCAHVYQGDPFPTEAPSPPAALSASADTSAVRTKTIPISFIRSKLNEFINGRQGLTPGSPSPALKRLRLDNSGKYGVLPDNYYDVQSIDASPPVPGTPVAVGYQEPVDWISSPTGLGQFSGDHGLKDAFLNDINSNSLTVQIDGTNIAPLSILVNFETEGPNEVVGYGSFSVAGIDLNEFSININLTLTHKPGSSIIDLMDWLDLPNLDELGWVTVVAKGSGLDGTFQKTVRTKIYDALKKPDPFTGKTPRDSINSLANSWFLGGVVDGTLHPENNCKVQNVVVTADNIQITYTGPQNAFVPPPPANWPAGVDFTEGTLANIDHIVVLTMENRSFDHMLGYLSLPPEKGGMGRAEVDGLTGDEFNLLNRVRYPSFAFKAGDTIFSPDPPHSYEPVGKAINGGKMDGFVSSYNEQRGPTVAPRIMGHHTGVTIPTYDSLARDFAISHRWFAPHPGPTFCNRFYELSGRLNIDPDGFWEFSNSASLKPVFTPTIFDYLSDPNYLKDPNTTWRYFEHGYCFLRFFEKHTFNTANIASFTDPVFGFVNLAKTGNLPSVSYIDPHFIELPPGGNCDGPPADVAQGQLLVKQVVEAVVSGPAWNKTLLIVTYDEHGGFFDHVPPPPAAQIAPGLPATFGVRVPAFVISPWVSGGSVFGHDATKDNTTQSLYFDHTSILKTIARRFLGSNPPYMGPRYAAANDLSSVLSPQIRPGPFRPFLAYSLKYGASGKCLDVPYATFAPGTQLWQYYPNGTIAQLFSFEDAGNGYFYIRAHTGSLYVTVDVPTSGSDASLGIKQDVKYLATGSGATNPDYQRWSFVADPSPVGSHTINASIHNAAFTDRVLHPAGDSVDIETHIVLEAGTSTGLALESKFDWVISSASLADQTGEVGPPTKVSGAVASPSALAFATQHVKTTSPQQTATITATGPMTISAVTLLTDTGAADADYSWLPTPGVSLPATIPQNGSFVVYVWFRPTATGSRNGQLQVTHNLPGSPLVIPLSGTGDATPIPILGISPPSLSFNPKKLTNHTLTLTNQGTAPLTIASIVLHDSNYTISNTCGVGPGAGTLQPGQSCTVNVVCHFIGPGGTSQLMITHDAAGKTTTVDLEATSQRGEDA